MVSVSVCGKVAAAAIVPRITRGLGAAAGSTGLFNRSALLRFSHRILVRGPFTIDIFLGPSSLKTLLGIERHFK